MKNLLLAVTLFAASSTVATPAIAASGPSRAVMAPIQAVAAATNADKARSMDAYFLPNAVVVDEFPPYMWSGANAASRWWTAFDMLGSKLGATNFRATALPIKQSNVFGNAAYVVVPVVITFAIKGKPQRETGLWTFTLQRSGAAWKIATVTWGTSTSTL